MSKDNQKVTGDSIYRVKMYKDGKRWVCAGATTLALAAGLVFANVNASADTTPANETKTEQVTSGASSSATSQAATSDASSASSTSQATSTTSQSTSTVSAATQSATSTTSAASSVASQNDTTQTAVATSAKVQSRAASVDTTATVQQATPTVTAPTSSATPKVTSEATLTTSEAASGSTSEATSTVATGSGSLAASHDVNANNVKVDGTTVAKTVKGQTYDMQVVLTKNKAIDWNTGRTNGQFSIAPAGSSETANGTWKAVSYQINQNTPVTIGTGSTIVVPVKDVINATTLTFNYEYTATNDTNSNSDYLSINDIPNADDKAHIEAAGNTVLYQNGWDYTAQTTTDVTTTTPAEDAQDVSVAYVVITGFNADGTPKYTQIAGGVTKSGKVGTTFTISPATIDGYALYGASNNVKPGDNGLTGTVDSVATNNEIVLVYAENTGIVANYQTADGTTLATPNQYTQGTDKTFTRAGGTYALTAPSLDGYTYVGYKIGDGDVAAGTLVAGANTVTFVYAPVVEQSDVTVNYVDADGKTIKAATTQTLDNGSTYKVETPTIDGYTYKSADAALTGTVDGNKTITLTYTKDSTTPVENKANLTINYVDADGNTIKASNVTEYIVGQAYTVGQPEIAGYTYDHATGDAIAGTIAYKGNTVTLVYTKNGGTTPTEQTKTITVNYVDADGNTIKSATTTTYKVGDTYTVATPTIDGYTYKSADGALSGTVADDATITLTYAKNDNGGSTTAPTNAPGTGDNGNNGGGTTTTAPTTAPGTGDNVNGGGTGTTTTAPVTTPSDDTVDNGNGSSNNGSSTTTTSTAPATTVSDDEVTPTTTATTNNGTSGVVPASASLKPVVTTKTTTSDAKTLPQTDEDENGTALAVLGLSTLLMGSALYFGVSRRKHEA
ncbi:MAG: MucBP domain-containing protein [Lactiplantibacillus plantarum]|nr:MucBP domain-containing protein [Lactiplantibacillus plantarum]